MQADAERIIAYCGGIALSITAFALTLLGFNNVVVYNASMLEWELMNHCRWNQVEVCAYKTGEVQSL